MQWVTAIRPYRRFALVLVGVLIVDLAVTAAVYVMHRDDPPALPIFRSVAADPRGAPYIPMPPAFGDAFLPDTSLRVSPAGRVRRPVGSELRLDPEAAARFALLQLAAYRSGQDRNALDRAGTALAELAPLLGPGPVENPFRKPLPNGTSLPVDWVSAQTQGLVLSALSQMYEATGVRLWRVRAARAFDAFLRIRDFPDKDGETPTRWITVVDRANFLWFEAFPQSPASGGLITGHNFAVLGLLDYSRVARGDRLITAKRLYQGGLATTLHYLHDVRFEYGPAWTSPAQLERSIPLHQVLRAQLDALARITDIPGLRRYEQKLTRDTKVAFFFTTGLDPIGDVDAYAPEPTRMLPPTSITVDDGAGSERSGTGKQSLDALLTSAIVDLQNYSSQRRQSDLASARRAITRVLQSSRRGLVAHTQPVVNVYGERLKHPWYSAQTQGLLLSALSRLHWASGDYRWSEHADEVFRSMQRVRGIAGNNERPPRIWIAHQGDDKAYANLWFEKYPHPQGSASFVRGSPSFVVDAHIAAVIGLYDYWRLTQRPLAARMFDGGVSTIVARLPDIRVPGGISKTALLADVNELDHHRVVTAQLSVLATMTGDKRLAAWAARFEQDAS